MYANHMIHAVEYVWARVWRKGRKSNNGTKVRKKLGKIDAKVRLEVGTKMTVN